MLHIDFCSVEVVNKDIFDGIKKVNRHTDIGLPVMSLKTPSNGVLVSVFGIVCSDIPTYSTVFCDQV